VWADKQGLQTFIPKADRVRINQLLDAVQGEYERKKRRSLPSFRSHLKPIRAAFGDMRAVALTTKQVEDYQNRRQDEDKKAPATINREIHILARAFKLGRHRKEIIADPYIPRLTTDNARQGFFERPDFEAVVRALPEYLQDFTRFAFLCAWRKGQTSSLKWEHVNRNAGEIIAPGQIVKNKKPHKIVLVGELSEIIERAWQGREYEPARRPPGSAGLPRIGNGMLESEYVFHHNGKRIRDLRKAWASACESAGVPGRLFHDLRRSGVRNMVRAGVSENVAMKISGHKTRAIFDRYNISSDEDIREAMKQTQEYLKAQPAVTNVVAIGKR
jgi:integrase